MREGTTNNDGGDGDGGDETDYIASLAEVEMHPSFSFYCEECGAENNVNVMFRETSVATQVLIPSLVTCKSCKTQYRGTPAGISFMR